MYRHYMALAAVSFFPFLAGADVLDRKGEETYMRRVESGDALRVEWFRSSHPEMTPAESDALRFLYAYMPEADMMDYSPEFYLENIKASLRARKEMPWGSIVPDREWRHFVLPVRVNNEDLDNSRPVFYEELKERVKGLSMAEAILEVNHWCHEKVTYRPSDARTSSPLSSVSQAIGRCGEESTFAVAALRAVGIPARQVYTPRWAHTDDNHAWVEAWADGKWHFIGACEPEPVLDLAWFNAPASRGMLMNTNVFGDYDGPEEVLLSAPLTTRINVTSNYAPVREVRVKVVDADGSPVEGANVDFCIYNYSEYFPVASKVTDASGEAKLMAGRGDMLLWVSDDFSFSHAHSKADDNAPVTVVLDRNSDGNGSFTLDLTPPAGGVALPEVSDVQRAENNSRFAMEDSIRNVYMSTFATPESAVADAARLGVDAEKLTRILIESRGNHAAIVKCLEGLDSEGRELAIRLLAAVSEKDRRDISSEVVAGHVSGTLPAPQDMDAEVYDLYVLNPRVQNEGLTDYKKVLRDQLLAEGISLEDGPSGLMAWVAKNIRSEESDYPVVLRMSPLSVMERRRTDNLSRDIFFVAAARSLGFPARIDPVTGKTQYMETSGEWIDVSLNIASGPVRKRRIENGWLDLSFQPHGFMVDPKYYSNFSISRIDGGRMRQLEYPEDATFCSTFSEPVAMDAGQYILTTGQRLADGGVLAASTVFTIRPGETVEIPLEVRHDDTALSVIGSLNAENNYRNLATGEEGSLLSTAGRGYYVVGLILPGHEPSAHSLNDISAVKDRLQQTGRKMIVLFSDDDSASRFDRSLFGELPENLVFGVDKDGVSLSELKDSLHLPDNVDMPVWVVADSFNRVVFVSTGYAIGLGETLLRTLMSVDE